MQELSEYLSLFDTNKDSIDYSRKTLLPNPIGCCFAQPLIYRHISSVGHELVAEEQLKFKSTTKSITNQQYHLTCHIA
jgi:hypothetical protein